MKRKSISWLAIVGKAAGKDDVLTYEGALVQDSNFQTVAIGHVRSNVLFDSGSIKFDVRFSQIGQRCHLVLNETSARSLFLGPNWGAAEYGAGAWTKGAWEPLAGIGLGNPVAPNRWVKCQIDVTGSDVTFYADGVLAFRINEVISQAPLSFWFEGLGKVEVRNIEIDDKEAEAFVVTQYGEVYDAIYMDVISPVLAEYGYKSVRADEVDTSGLIIEQINEMLRRSAIVVADITPDNPNVYYEVGYAHALGKPTILLCDKKRERLPFDLSGFRTIFYENSIRGKPKVEEQLRRHLALIARKPGYPA